VYIEHKYLRIFFIIATKPVLQYAMSVVGSDSLLHVSGFTQKIGEIQIKKILWGNVGKGPQVRAEW